MKRILQKVRMKRLGDFTGGPVVKTSFSTARGMDSIPGGGTKIPHAWWYMLQLKKKKKRERERGMKRLSVMVQMVKNLPAVQKT